MIRLPKKIQTIGEVAFNSCNRLKFVLYCNRVAPENAFLTVPMVHVLMDYQVDKFCGCAVTKNCDIPPGHFTIFENLQATGFDIHVIGMHTD